MEFCLGLPGVGQYQKKHSLTVSCSSKIQIGFTFLVPAHPGSPGQRAVKWLCVCVFVLTREGTISNFMLLFVSDILSF